MKTYARLLILGISVFTLAFTGTVYAATCPNNVKDGNETDKDCGGLSGAAYCPTRCAAGKVCNQPTDCASGLLCVGVGTKTCLAPTPTPTPLPCFNNIQDNGETDLNCGGPSCAKCTNGLKCLANSDCNSGHCDSGLCTTPKGIATIEDVNTISNDSNYPSSSLTVTPNEVRTFNITSTHCPNTLEVTASLGILNPTGTPLGVVVFFGPLTGGYYYGAATGAVQAKKTITDLRDAGYITVDAKFIKYGSATTDGWTPNVPASSSATHGMLASACRVATVVKYVRDQIVPNSTPLCLTGHSTGSAAVAYALSSYDADSNLGVDYALMSAGPPMTNIADLCLDWYDLDGDGQTGEWLATCKTYLNSYYDQGTCYTGKTDTQFKGICYANTSIGQPVFNKAQGITDSNDSDDTNDGYCYDSAVTAKGQGGTASKDYLVANSLLASDSDLKLQLPVHFVWGKKDCSLHASLAGRLYRDKLIENGTALADVTETYVTGAVHDVQVDANGQAEIYNKLLAGCSGNRNP